MVKAALQGRSVGRRNQQTHEGESEIYNSIFVVTFNGLLGRLNRLLGRLNILPGSVMNWNMNPVYF